MHVLRAVECHSTLGLIKSKKNPFVPSQWSVSLSFGSYDRIWWIYSYFLWLKSCNLFFLTNENGIVLTYFFKRKKRTWWMQMKLVATLKRRFVCLKTTKHALSIFTYAFNMRFLIGCLFPWESFIMSKMFWCQCHQSLPWSLKSFEANKQNILCELPIGENWFYFASLERKSILPPALIPDQFSLEFGA